MRLSADSITAGQRALQTPADLVAMITGRSIVHQRGSKPYNLSGDGLMDRVSRADGEQALDGRAPPEIARREG